MKSKRSSLIFIILLSMTIILSYNVSASYAYSAQNNSVHKQSMPDPQEALCGGYWLNVAQDWVPMDFNYDGTYNTYGQNREVSGGGYYALDGFQLDLSRGDTYIYSRVDEIPWHLQDSIKSVYSEFVNNAAADYGLSYVIEISELADDEYIFFCDYGDDLGAAFLVPLFYNAKNSDDISVTLNGEEIYFDQPPIIVDGRTLVPLRAVFEAMGASVEWYQDSQSVMSERDGIVVGLTIGEYDMYAGGDFIRLDVPPQVVNNRTLVPVRAISEAFGASVYWDNDTRTVVINF